MLDRTELNSGVMSLQRFPFWIRDSHLCVAKCVCGLYFENYHARWGTYEYFTKTHESRFEARLMDQLPWLKQRFEEKSKGSRSSTLGHLLVRRGEVWVSRDVHKKGCNERARFMTDDYSYVLSEAQRVFENKEYVASVDRIYEVLEKSVMARTVGPCVYLRWDQDKPRVVYIGSTGDIFQRDHNSSTAHIVQTFSAFSTSSMAGVVEQRLHEWMKEQGCTGYREGPKRGLWTTPWDDPVRVIESHVHLVYRGIFHTSGRICDAS